MYSRRQWSRRPSFWRCDRCLPAACPLQILSSGERIDNITDWAFNQFLRTYGANGVPEPLRDQKDAAKPPARSRATGSRKITKDEVFCCVYAILHDPLYRAKYALNLKREFPRIPFYPDFWRWAAWGKDLLDIHITYEREIPWPVKRIDTPDTKARSAGVAPRPILRADRGMGIVYMDTETRLEGVPAKVWDYQLGNWSAIEWLLEQFKEKMVRDPVLSVRFDTYHFADCKEKAIDLVSRVVAVSVKTLAIVDAMKDAER